MGVIESVKVIESGAGWMNVEIVAGDVDPTTYPVTRTQTIVNSGELPSFATTSAETAFFMSNRVTTLSPSTYGVSADQGYNAGNYLIGLILSS